ncbi:MAG TPA: class I SAM-dependent methyltransferase [Verrucomicrobiae bacterium]|nr:class I SAM-dependent methyltransferase [Verrucomicrobiae bacterium]
MPVGENELRYQAKEDDPYSSHSVILRFAGEGGGRRLLDVGSAQGVLAQRFRERGFEVTCIEGDRALAALGRDKCDAMIVADLDQGLPELKGRFDVIVCGDILEHLKRPSALLAGLSLYLKATGWTILSVPNVAHAFVRLNLLFGRFEYMEQGILDRTHLRFFTRQSFCRFLEEAGWTIEQMTSTPVPLLLILPAHRERIWLRAVHAINAGMARVWPTMFGYQFVALTRPRGSA